MHSIVQKGQKVVSQALRKEKWAPTVVQWCREFGLLKKTVSSLFPTSKYISSNYEKGEQMMLFQVIYYHSLGYSLLKIEFSLHTHKSQSHGKIQFRRDI